MAASETVVLDASTVLDWFDHDGRGSYADSLRTAIYCEAIQPIAPFHFQYECATVLMRHTQHH